MTFEEALSECETDITGSLWGVDYDNFSPEESAFVDGVNQTQQYFKKIIEALKEAYEGKETSHV